MATGFLEEKPGVKSSERLKSILTLIFFFVFVWGYLIYKDKEITTEFNFLAGLILVAAFTPTAIKKIVEIRTGNIQPTKSESTTSTTETKTTDTVN